MFLSSNDEEKFEVATKRIAIVTQVKSHFMQSQACKQLVEFITELGKAVRSKPNSAQCQISKNSRAVIVLLETVEQLVEETPPAKQKMRYGNTAFRDFYAKFARTAEKLQVKLLPEKLQGALKEISPYLLDSFGNSARIDYGTGHELHFVAWLFCLCKLGLFMPADRQALVTKVFYKYILLCRKIQATYLLEPAGSKGVWCLDDYQFLPFYFGASQLIGNNEIRPSYVLDGSVLQQSEEYIYLSGIKFINKMKTGPFQEHSPFLSDAMRAPNWTKVQSGLMRMFHDHVLTKFPVIQHFLFGSLLSIDLPPIGAKEHKSASSIRPQGRQTSSSKGLTPDDPDPVSGVVPWQAVPQKGRATVPVTGVAPWAMSDSYMSRIQNKAGPTVNSGLSSVPWAKPPRKEFAEGPQRFETNDNSQKMKGMVRFESGSVSELKKRRIGVKPKPIVNEDGSGGKEDDAEKN